MSEHLKLQIIKNIVLFIVGFSLYITIEVCFRGYSYQIMGVCAGLTMVLLDKINDKISWDTDILLQCIMGSLLVTDMELFIGGLSFIGLIPKMWDYSSVPLNFYGIICLPFSLIWVILSLIGIMLSDAINYYLFEDSDVPYYKLFGKTILRFRKKHCDK